jgi:dynein heavy chain
MTGGAWNINEGTIVDTPPGKPNSTMPIIWFKPVVTWTINEDEETYQCPLYVTATRGGVISTSGTSSNFITAITLPTKDPAKWTLRACALLCQHN